MTPESLGIPFSRTGPDRPLCPVVIAVPHAGRYYPQELLDAAIAPRAALETLEDRYADLLLADAIEAGATAIVAHHARAWVDLNRDPREIDPAMLSPSPATHEVLPSAKVRAGLGLIPRRVGGASISHGRLSPDAVAARIAGTHEPYHAAVAAALREARTAFGAAILIDCHSMPPLPDTGGEPAPRIVIGDLHGRSADARFVARAADSIRAAGIGQARNAPYAGAYTLRRHGHPNRALHAMQIEVDRSLYLGADQLVCAAGLAPISRLLADIVRSISDEAYRSDFPAAAE